MKRISKLAVVLAAALTLSLALTACDGIPLPGSSFDATTYIKGTLDSTYLGIHDEAYLDLVESTEKECEEYYEQNITAEYEQRFSRYFEIDDEYITDETRDGIKDLLRQVYSNAKYEVEAATKLDGGEYSVKVTFHPISLFADFYEDDYDAFADELNARYEDVTTEMLDAMTDEEYEAFQLKYQEDWASSLLKAMEPKLASVAYQDAVTKLIRVYPDENDNNYYTISDEDYMSMDGLILAY